MSNSRPEKPEAGSPAAAGNSFITGGEMGRLVREMDWSQTPLGPISSWPKSLLTTVNLCLASNFPISLAWGPQHIQIYNDGYWPICGDKHPQSLGQDFAECWASAFPAIGDAFRSAQAGTTAFLEDQRMFLDRLGYLEETFFTFSFSPIRDETGNVVGLFHPVTETTGKILAQRRTRALRDVAAHGLNAQSLKDALRLTAKTLADFNLDLPFALFYLMDEDTRTAHLVSQAGLPPDGAANPAVVNLMKNDAPWPLAQVAATNTPLLLDDVRQRCSALVCDPYPESIASALLLPLTLPGLERPTCFLVAGVSPRLPLNEDYTSFYELLTAAVSGVLASAAATEAKRKRAEALAEIDRAKTEFFANVSHEFRTPLTLMIGPLEEELAEPDNSLASARRERLVTAHRNSLRLLKLVNALLDFSRIEAGRAQARYQPTDLAAYTAELASTFRSAIEHGGVSLLVDCPSLPELVYVDCEMWEKIVLNLLSNAFKHTFEGSIGLALRWAGDHVELVVTDTGVGIPESELPHLFERFYRVKDARARTLEGTGIGLSLVQALVQAHGGSVQASSVEGRGSSLTVTIKTGKAHLPADHIAAPTAPINVQNRAAAFVEEALQWTAALPAGPESATANGASPDRRPRILWADDNADMRDYVCRLLVRDYRVTTVADGAAALAAARATPPDLVLLDIMMPVLDGLGVLRELRADTRTRDIPVMLLSARAGEEAALGGLAAGADDYLVKPFSANELLVRVRTRLELTRMRRDAASELERQVQQRTADIQHNETEVRRLLADAEDSRRTLLGILEDQQRAEAALTKSQALLRATAERARMGGWELELSSGAITWTEQIYRIYEVDDDFQPNVSSTVDFYAPESRPVIAEAVRRAIELGEPFDLELVLVTARGNRRQVHAVGAAHRADGQAKLVSGTFQDITGQKLAEEALRESEANFRLLAESAPQLIWICRPDGWNIYFNQRWVDYTGLSLEESYGHGWNKPFHPDDQPRAWDAWQQATQHDAPYDLECRLRRADGVYRWFVIRGLPLRNANGEISKWFGTCTDIDDLKQTEVTLRASEERFRRAVVDSPFPILLHAEDGAIIQASQSWCDISGYTRDELATIGDWTERAYGERKQLVQADIDRLYGLDHRIAEGDYSVRTKSGTTHIWEFSSAPLGRLPDGRRLVISMALDVTERRQAAQKLQEQLNELQRWQAAMLGREGRVLELKREVNRLLIAAGQPARFASAATGSTINSLDQPTAGAP